jgi:hypothetical protein
MSPAAPRKPCAGQLCIDSEREPDRIAADSDRRARRGIRAARITDAIDRAFGVAGALCDLYGCPVPLVLPHLAR